MIERHITFASSRTGRPTSSGSSRSATGRRSSRCPGSSSAASSARPSTPSATRWCSAGRTADQAVAWRVSPVHQALQPELNELHEGMEIVAYAKVA